MSYCSKRCSQAISSESRNPAVVISAVAAPLRSINALVASVVPCTTSPTSPGGHLASARIARTPSMTPRSGAPVVVRTLVAWLPAAVSRTTSVNVPPISTARRARFTWRSQGNALEHLDEAVDVLLVVVDVRADPEPPEPRRGIDVLRRELLRQVVGHALGEG